MVTPSENREDTPRKQVVIPSPPLRARNLPYLACRQKQSPRPGEAHGAQNPRCAPLETRGKRDDNTRFASRFREAQ